MKVIVTGGAGFIGTNLLHLLRNRYHDTTVVSLDIRQPAYPVDGVVYELCDVRDSEKLIEAIRGADSIFHLAALIGTHESLDRPYAAFDTNVQGTINVLECAKQFDCSVFVAAMPGIWNNPYSISKDASVRMAQCYYETFKVKVCALRWFSVYGPYQYISRYNKAVPTFINQALKNEPLTVYGDGTQIADFIHTEDALTYAIEMIEGQYWGEVVECASGKGISINDLAASIISLCESSSAISHLPMRQGEPEGAIVVANTQKLDELFPDHTRMSLMDGLSSVIEYYKLQPAVD